MDAIILLIFLFILAIGISTILYVSKRENTDTTRHFNLMAGWSLGIYLLLAFFVLLAIADTIPN